MAGSRPQPFKGISIQATPAPLLGLQHAANVPGSPPKLLVLNNQPGPYDYGFRVAGSNPISLVRVLDAVARTDDAT